MINVWQKAHSDAYLSIYIKDAETPTIPYMGLAHGVFQTI
jgi:hypothetical protein